MLDIQVIWKIVYGNIIEVKVRLQRSLNLGF